MADTIKTSRRRPLYAFGTSTLEIAHNLYSKAIKLNGPIGSVTKRLAKLGSVASPLVYAIQYQWLVILSFVDDHILSMETIVESYFPPSRHVFDKVDNIVVKIEDFPRKFEDTMNKFPVILHEIPLLDWAMIHAIKWLECITSALIVWGVVSVKEKDIMVDTNCKDQNGLNETSPSTRNEKIRDSIGGDNNNNNNNNNNNREFMPTVKYSYKEALEKGVKENMNEEVNPQGDGMVDVKENVAKDDMMKEARKGYEKIENTKVDIDEIMTKEDPLLELFEFGWEAPKEISSMSRSSSQIEA